MTLVVGFKNEDFPDGMEWDIGLGVLVPNCGSVTVSDELANKFKQRNGKTVREYFKNNPQVTVTDSKKGGDD